jgi:hypothetical protein
MHYISIGTFPKDPRIMGELASRRRDFVYPASFSNVASFLDVQDGRAIVHFETDKADDILAYSASWPEVTFDISPVVPSGEGWSIYLTLSK